MRDFKFSKKSSLFDIFYKIICIFFLKEALGSSVNLVGISFHRFELILEKDTLTYDRNLCSHLSKIPTAVYSYLPSFHSIFNLFPKE